MAYEVINIPIKFSEEISNFIEGTGCKEDEDWFWLPHYFKKVGDGLYEICEFKEVGRSLKRIIEQDLPTKENEEE